jgi:hypothetical protein
MESRVVGLYHWSWGPSPAQQKGRRSPVSLYRYAVWFKANPRSREYMRALFEERYPGGMFLESDDASTWRAAIRSAGIVVLLYPDATGIGWRRVDRETRRLLAPQAVLRVLNGRRRDFALDGATRRALVLRRLLERSMLAELAFIPVFLCTTPVLLLNDWLRGRR